MLKIKNIIKLGMIVIIQGNKEVLHIACVIQSIAYLKKKIIMELTMIIISSEKSKQKNLKNNVLVKEKT